MSGTISSFVPSRPEPTQPVVLTVAAGGGAAISSVSISILLPGMESPEVAYASGAFTGNYTGYSATWGNSSSRGFSLLRQHGWTNPPLVSVEVTYNDGLVLRSSSDGSSSSVPGGGGGGGGGVSPPGSNAVGDMITVNSALGWDRLTNNQGDDEGKVLTLTSIGGGYFLPSWQDPQGGGGNNGEQFPAQWDSNLTYLDGQIVGVGESIYQNQSGGPSDGDNPTSGAPWVEISVDGMPAEWNGATVYAHYDLASSGGHIFANIDGDGLVGGDPPGGGNMDWIDLGAPGGGGEEDTSVPTGTLIRNFTPSAMQSYGAGQTMIPSAQFGPSPQYGSLLPVCWTLPAKVGNVGSQIIFQFGARNGEDPDVFITRTNNTGLVVQEVYATVLASGDLDAVDGYVCKSVQFAGTNSGGVQVVALGNFAVRGYQT